MQIEIQKPEVGQRFMQQIKNGQFRDADELLTKALDALDEKSPASTAPAPAKNLVELFEPLRGLFTDEEVDTLFSRNPSTSRPLDLA